MSHEISNSFYLEPEDGILYLRRKNSPEKVSVDFLEATFQQRLKTLKSSQDLMKAVAIRKGLKILDATAGLGKDALSFAFMGADVLAVEEHPMVFAILEDGLKRAFQYEKFAYRFENKIRLEKASSLDFLNSKNDFQPDVIYLDPMYPLTKKSAKPKKDMEFLRELVPVTDNLEDLLKASLNFAKERVVLKRPVNSDFLLKKPRHSFKSKLVRFDMYSV